MAVARSEALARRAALAALYGGVGLPRVAGAAPTVAVVGAGLAGLTAAYLLDRAGCETTVFEADTRIGGRVWTEAGPDGQVWELGGEFIDSTHTDMLALADHFGLALLDTAAPGDAELQTAYRFGGRAYSQREVDAAWADVAPRVAADVAALSGRPSRSRHGEADRRFDRMSIAEYLERLRLERWLHDLLEAAYVTVYGLDAGEQSSLNLLTLIGTDPARGFEAFGDSDERYKIRDGSARVVDALARPLGERIRREHRLVRLRGAGSALRLDLATPGATAGFSADVVVLALPFTLLRQVDCDELLSAPKRRAVDALGYGSNAKLLQGMRRPVWRDARCDGGIYTDLGFQTSWDCSRGRAADGSVFTFFLGGSAGAALGEGGAERQAERLARLADAVWPGFSAQRTGAVRRVHWPSEPFALGAYTCYRPGQWTTIGGDEGGSDGRLVFAGEHCAAGSQGYMDGAVETGREAALAVLRGLS